MKRVTLSKTGVAALGAAAVVFVVWAITETADVHRQRELLAADVMLISKMTALERSVDGFERILLDEGGVAESPGAESLWRDLDAGYLRALRAFTPAERQVPGIDAALLRVDENVVRMRATRRQLVANADPVAEVSLRMEFRSPLVLAGDEIRSTVGGARDRLGAISNELAKNWDLLNALVFVACLLSLVTVSLLAAMQRQVAKGRKVQQSLRMVIEQMPAMVWTIDRNCLITSSRGSGLKRLNLENDQLTGTSLFEYLQTDDPSFAPVGAHLRALEGESVNYEMEWAGNAYESHVEPLRDDSGSIVGAIGVGIDVTELSRERIRSQKLESLGVLAGGIAHDFNNFLQAMLGNLALLRMDLPPEADTRDRVEETERAARRAQRLTQQLLTFSGGGEPIVRTTHLERVIRDSVIFAVRGSAVRADLDVAADLWPAKIDDGQIGQAIGNIVINAVQAMPRGGRIRVEARNVTSPRGKWVEIVFADEGEGIEPENIARVFDPYFSTKDSGSGLGLASAYSVIRRHGGDIDVESVVGEGTRFTIELPAGDPTDAVAMRANRGPRAGAGRVLVMDDDETVLRATCHMLERLGYDAHGVLDGEQALEAYRLGLDDDPFDVVVMDLTVPGGVGGVESVARMREIDPFVCAIASSGHSNDRVMSRHEARGFVAVLPKPYGIEELGQTLADAIFRSRLRVVTPISPPDGVEELTPQR